MTKDAMPQAFHPVGAATPLAMAGKRDERDQDPGGPGTSVIAKTRPQTKRPSLYRVLLLNDDYTPMEFVVAIIQEYFNKDRETATQIMLSVHRHGKGVCGVFSKDIACTKVEFVLTHARKAGHPLQCVMEEV
jgi:ATP-dependent Clp protease adaptor protein ClpS